MPRSLYKQGVKHPLNPENSEFSHSLGRFRPQADKRRNCNQSILKREESWLGLVDDYRTFRIEQPGIGHCHVWTLPNTQGLLNEHNDSGLPSCIRPVCAAP